jgi:hypothetical protein
MPAQYQTLKRVPRGGDREVQLNPTDENFLEGRPLGFYNPQDTIVASRVPTREPETIVIVDPAHESDNNDNQAEVKSPEKIFDNVDEVKSPEIFDNVEEAES